MLIIVGALVMLVSWMFAQVTRGAWWTGLAFFVGIVLACAGCVRLAMKLGVPW